MVRELQKENEVVTASKSPGAGYSLDATDPRQLEMLIGKVAPDAV
jgi:hypothetical protein